MQVRKLAALLTLLAMVAALMPLTASVAFAGDQGDSGLCQCDPLFQKQIQTRTFDPGRDEVTEDQYRWHRSFGGDKQVKGWEYEDGWKNRYNDNWYTIPAFLNPPFIGTIPSTGTVSLSQYGGPNVIVQYRYTEQGEEWYPSEDGYASEEDFQANATGGGWKKVAENPANPVVTVEGIEPSYGPWGPWTPFGDPTTDPRFDGIKVLDRAGPGDEGGDDAVKRAQYVDAGEDCSNLTYTVEVPADTEGVTYAFGQFGGGFTELEPTNLDPGTYTVLAQVQDGFEVGDPGEWTQAEDDPTVFFFNVEIEEGSKPCVREVPPLGATEIPEPVDYCDDRNRPGGTSLAAWLAQGGNPDCIDLNVGDECRVATGTITRNETRFTWAVAFEEGTATYDLGNAQFGSISFPEDYNGGSVEVAYYLVGPEGDYGKISGEPNFWNQSAATITVDTDCEDPEPEPEPTTAVVTGECIPGGLDGVFGANFRINYDLGEGVTLFVAGQSVTGEGIIHLDGAGTYDYTLEVEGEFTLGDTPLSGEIVIEDCTPTTTTTEPEPEQEETTTTTVPEETSSTTTEPEEEETTDTLPFTGIGSGPLAGAGLLALIAGAGLTLLARKGEEEMA